MCPSSPPLPTETFLQAGRTVRIVNEDGEAVPQEVVLGGLVSEVNSTTTPLGPSGTFTGEWVEILDLAVIFVTTFSDVASGTDGLVVQQSPDGINPDNTDEFSVPAAKGKTYSFQAAPKFGRILYTNGPIAQTEFRLQTVLKKTNAKPSSHRIDLPIIEQDDAELVKAVQTGLSDITGVFENVNTYRQAMSTDAALVHRIGINQHARRDLGATTTLTAEASAGDTLLTVADITGFSVGDLLRISNGSGVERCHFQVTAAAGSVITLNKPIDNTFAIGSDVTEIQVAMNVSGTLASPISFKIQPPSDERWQMTRLLITMLDASAMDDGKFGGITALANGVIVRQSENSVFRTLTTWQSNSNMKDDMYDITYSAKAPAGEFGLSGRWTFTRAQFVVDLDGTTGDFLEVLIQDDLTGLLNFGIKVQGRLFGG